MITNVAIASGGGAIVVSRDLNNGQPLATETLPFSAFTSALINTPKGGTSLVLYRVGTTFELARNASRNDDRGYGNDLFGSTNPAVSNANLQAAISGSGSGGLTPAQAADLAKIPGMETQLANTANELTAGETVKKGDTRSLTIADVIFTLARKVATPTIVNTLIDIDELSRWTVRSQFPATSTVFPASTLIPKGYRLQLPDGRVLINKAARLTLATIVLSDWTIDSTVNSAGEGTLYRVGDDIEPGSYRRYDIGITSIYLNYTGVAKKIVTMTPTEMALWKLEGQEYPATAYPAALVVPKGFEYKESSNGVETVWALRNAQLCPATFTASQWEIKSQTVLGLNPNAVPYSYPDTQNLFPPVKWVSGATAGTTMSGSIAVATVPDGTSAFLSADGDWAGLIKLAPPTQNSVPLIIKRTSGWAVAIDSTNTNIPGISLNVGAGEIVRFIPTSNGWRWVPPAWLVPAPPKTLIRSIVASTTVDVIPPDATTVLYTGGAAGVVQPVTMPSAIVYPGRSITLNIGQLAVFKDLEVTAIAGGLETPATLPIATISNKVYLNGSAVTSVTWQSDGANWRLRGWVDRRFYPTSGYTRPATATTFYSLGVPAPLARVPLQIPDTSTSWAALDSNYTPIIALPINANSTGRYSVYAANTGGVFPTTIVVAGTDLPSDTVITSGRNLSMHFYWANGLWRWTPVPMAVA
jgi:hypothetical protein